MAEIGKPRSSDRGSCHTIASHRRAAVIDVAGNVARVQERIARAAMRAGGAAPGGGGLGGPPVGGGGGGAGPTGGGRRQGGGGPGPGQSGGRGHQGRLRPGRAEGSGGGVGGAVRAAREGAHDDSAPCRAWRAGSGVVPPAPRPQGRGGARAPLDGDERRLRGRRGGRRDDGARRHRHLRPEGDMSVKGKKVGFLGAGNMGEAMIRGLLKAGTVPAEDIFATDARLDRLQQLGKLYGIHTLSDNSLLVKRVDVVILAVKPQIIHSVLKEVGSAVTPKKLVISVAAGVPTVALRADLPKGVRLIRVMPNTPARSEER